MEETIAKLDLEAILKKYEEEEKRIKKELEEWLAEQAMVTQNSSSQVEASLPAQSSVSNGSSIKISGDSNGVTPEQKKLDPNKLVTIAIKVNDSYEIQTVNIKEFNDMAKKQETVVFPLIKWNGAIEKGSPDIEAILEEAKKELEKNVATYNKNIEQGKVETILIHHDDDRENKEKNDIEQSSDGISGEENETSVDTDDVSKIDIATEISKQETQSVGNDEDESNNTAKQEEDEAIVVKASEMDTNSLLGLFDDEDEIVEEAEIKECKEPTLEDLAMSEENEVKSVEEDEAVEISTSKALVVVQKVPIQSLEQAYSEFIQKEVGLTTKEKPIEATVVESTIEQDDEIDFTPKL